MLPTIRQRLIITAAALVGMLGWLVASGPLRATDGGTGLSLTTAQIGFGWSVPIVALAGLPALGAGLVASATGNPLAGMFAFSAALCVLAAWGGSIQGWVFRHDANLPGDYGGLILEMFIWQVGLVVMVVVICYLAAPVRQWLPAMLSDKKGGLTHFDSGRDRFGSLAVVPLCAVIAGVCTVYLVRSTETSQVIWSLILAFFIGGLVAKIILPRSNAWGVMLSPSLVAIVGYAWALIAFDSDSYLPALYTIGDSTMAMPGVLLVLPIHYASAGVVGCTLGIGCAQSLSGSRARLEGA